MTCKDYEVLAARMHLKMFNLPLAPEESFDNLLDFGLQNFNLDFVDLVWCH
jgi:hypothetical protein